jgi:thiol-disulfide isomerase/thioredoxin
MPGSTEAEPAVSPPPAETGAGAPHAAWAVTLPARIGLVLAEPRRGLALAEARGSGVTDTGWLVLLGILCFRLEDMMRALLGVTHLSLGTVLRQILAVVSYEVREAVFVVLPAAVLVTLAAGRGRRDPGRDLELAAACYVPFFAVRALYRTLDHEAFLGPLPGMANQIFTLLGLGWAVVLLVLAVALARKRPLASATGSHTEPGEGGLSSSVEAGAPPRRRARVAVTVFAAMLGAAVFVNVGWVFQHADAIRPLGRGTDAPVFSLPRVDGKPGEVSLISLRGKVVLLDFWATWCAPCMHMFPTLHRLYRRWQGQGVEFVGINADGGMVTAEQLATLLQAQPAPYPMVIDREGEVGSLYKVVALPHLVLIRRDGTIYKTFWGVTSESEITQALSALAAPPP